VIQTPVLLLILVLTYELVANAMVSSTSEWLRLCEKHHRPIVIALVLAAIILLALIHKL
jgi:hypothetical protein